MADKAKGTPVTADHIFRIASCSKPYTGMAIMKLVEGGKLKLIDKVFCSGALLYKKYFTKEYSWSLKEITFAQLLLNTLGSFVDAQKRDLVNTREELSHKTHLS